MQRDTRNGKAIDWSGTDWSLSPREIAKLRGVSVNTVRSARRRLRDVINYNPPPKINWDNVPLGIMTDRELAQLYAVSRLTHAKGNYHGRQVVNAEVR